MKSSQKSGTQCVIVPENKKVMAPRNLELITKTIEKDQTEDLINKEIEDKQLTTNVTVDLLDELITKYHPEWALDIRVPNSSKGTEAENTNSAVKELLIPWTQSSQSSDQLPNSDLNVQGSHASFASTSTENCPQTQSSGADLREMLQTLETGSATGNGMMLSPEAGFEMLQNLEASFKDDTEISHSQGAVYHLDKELMLLQEAALELNGEMSAMDSRFFQSNPAKNCREDAECSTDTEPSDHHSGFEYESVMDQEMTCDELPEEIPKDKFSLGYIYII